MKVWSRTIDSAGAILFGLAFCVFATTFGLSTENANAAHGVSGTVTTHVRNSGGTCASSYQHVWVTVSDVMAHTSQGGWQDLTPGLSAAPVQIDLLDPAPTDCFLATLGVTNGLPAGKYQQIRIILDDGTVHGNGKGHGKGKNKNAGTAPASNACDSLDAGVFNCIQLSDDSFVPLSLTSTGKTGIKIPPGQIAGHGLTVSPGQGVDLDIDFNACKSVVQAGKSGRFNLKPTLHAGEVDLSAVVAGTVQIGQITGSNVIANGPAIAGASLLLESQTPSNNYSIGTPGAGGSTAQVENVVAAATSAADGSFGFCPVPPGTYEVVAAAILPPNDATNATITTDVTVSANGGPNDLVIPLLDDGVGPALLEGLFTTQMSSSSAGSGDDIAFAGVQPFAGNSGTVQAIVPALTGTIPSTATATTLSSPTGANCPDLSPPTCPADTNCECFTLALPASNPVIGAAGSMYATPAPSPSPAGFAVTGSASKIGSPSTPECSPANMITDPTSLFIVTGGAVTSATSPTLSFNSCD